MGAPASAEVVVVGAGLAGLAAAVRLQAAGLDTIVVEQSDGVGGRVRTDVVDGFRLDRGFQLLNPSYPEAARLLDLDALDLQPFQAGVVVCTSTGRHTLGDPRRLPGTIRDDLTAPVGSIRQKLAFGTWAAGLGLGSARSILTSADRPLIEELAARGLDGALTEKVLRPFLSGVLADDRLESSQRVASLLLRAFARGNPSVPALGMQAMPDQLAARLRPGSLHLDVSVTAIHTGRVDTAGGSIRTRAVVCAVTGDVAEGFALPGSPMRSLTTWWYAAAQPPSNRALLHVDAERRGPLANTVVMTNAAPTYSSDGRALVAATAVGAHRDGEPDARRHAGLLHGVDPSGWDLLRTDVIASALPQHLAGQPLRQPVDLGEGLFVAGDHRDTPSIQGALVSGRRAADAVLAQATTRRSANRATGT
ncbi:MAG: FAD-dependent oxidoreductase [Nocardioides sp.]